MSESARDVQLLLVGKDELLRELRAKVLRSCGYTVISCSDYGDAVAVCKPGKYDAVLVCGDHDEKEALDFCTEVREVAPEQVVIVITRPHVYIPAGACPDEVVQDGPSQLVEAVKEALA